jgi:hypothetical protein
MSNLIYYFFFVIFWFGIILLSVIVVILFFLCIYLETNTIEGFYFNPYVNNEINTKLQNNVANLDNLNIFKKPNFDNIATNIRNELNLNDDTEYNVIKKLQTDDIANIERELYVLNSNINNMNIKKKKETLYRSVKSEENSQPINLFPLSNNKYLISLNGKCLESDSFNRNTIEPCNSQNPNQYFDLELITNSSEYKEQTFGQIHNTSNVKYPFHIVKSNSGNCIGTNDGYLTSGTCSNTKKQRWQASEKPVLCVDK